MKLQRKKYKRHRENREHRERHKPQKHRLQLLSKLITIPFPSREIVDAVDPSKFWMTEYSAAATQSSGNSRGKNLCALLKKFAKVLIYPQDVTLSLWDKYARNFTSDVRITWQTSFVILANSSRVSFGCGGVLITNKHVLTGESIDSHLAVFDLLSLLIDSFVSCSLCHPRNSTENVETKSRETRRVG